MPPCTTSDRYGSGRSPVDDRSTARCADDATRPACMTTHRALLLGALLALSAGQVHAQDYYVDPVNGSDANSGATTSTTLKTLAHAASLAVSGDTIRLIAGGTFRETNLTITGASVVAYGSGAPPVITASVVVGAWSPWAGHPGVLSAYVPGAAVLALYAQGTLQTLARTPNKDAADPYLHNQNATDPTTLVVPALAGDNQIWAGAQVRWRRWSWWWETRAITADNGSGTLSLDPASEQVSTGPGGLVSAQSCFYIDNSLAALDEAGEWFYDQATSMLYFQPPTGVDPTAGDVEVVTTTNGIITGPGASFTGITFRGFAGTALSVNQHATVTGCLFREIEDTGLSIGYSAGGTQVSGCTFADIRNCGIQINQNPASSGTTVSGNTMARIGMVPGYGGSGAYHSNGVVMTAGSNIMITGNRMSDIGAVGVLLGTGCNGNHALKNVLIRCMSQLNDGAAIYGDCNACDIQNNIIIDAIGNLSTSQPWTPLGHGIWLDTVDAPGGTSGWSGHTIANNVVVGSGGHGLWMPHQFSSTISSNILLGNQLSQLQIDNAGDATNLSQGLTMTANALVAVTEQRYLSQAGANLISWAVTGPDDCIRFDNTVNGSAVSYGSTGSMSGTVLIWPSSSATMAESVTSVTTGSGSTADLTSVAAWQSGRPWTDASPTPFNRDAVVVVNDTASTASVTLPAGTWIDTSSTTLGSSVSLPAYTGKVIIAGAGVSVSSLPPITLASSVNYSQSDPFTVGTCTWISTGPVAGTAAPPAATAGSSSGKSCGLGVGASAMLLFAVSLVRRRRQAGW
jgi:hypothetical protein